VVLVASDRPDAYGLERARAAGIETAVIRPIEYPDRAAFDEALTGVVAAARPDVVCLAGFMRILGPGFVRAFPARIVNTHPSLLPAFRGAHAVRDALAYGVRVTGCTVHLVDEEVDHGPVLMQAPVAVEDGDDEASLHDRIKREEHRLLPAAVRLVALGRIRLDGRRARLLAGAVAPAAGPVPAAAAGPAGTSAVAPAAGPAPGQASEREPIDGGTP